MTHIHSGLAAKGVGVQTQDGRDSLPCTSAQSIAAVTIPDTLLVRDVTALIREAEDDLLFDHSRRVFLFGALQGQRRGLRAFNDGDKHRAHSTFGNVNADVLEYFDPSFVRDNFVDVIRNNCWPE